MLFIDDEGGGGGTIKPYQNICLLSICWYKKTNYRLRFHRSNNWFMGGPFKGFRRLVSPNPCQNICLLTIYRYKKQKKHPNWTLQIIDVWKVQNYIKIFVSKTSTDIKKKNYRPRLSRSNSCFWGVNLRGFRGLAPSNYVKIIVF